MAELGEDRFLHKERSKRLQLGDHTAGGRRGEPAVEIEREIEVRAEGFPRRYIDYPIAFALWNKVSSYGYAVTLLGLGVFLLVLIEAAVRRRKAEANPWGVGATTLEWTLSSPPPFHQFSELPVIRADSQH